MVRRRLALLVTALPLAFYAYACSDDPTTPPATDEDAGNGQDSGPTIPVDGSTPTPQPDATTDTDAGDAGDAGVVVLECVGNPLTADGGTSDGGVLINPDGGALKAIATGPFLDGPQWIEDGIVYSEVNSQVIVRNGPDGGARVVLRATGANNLPIGNARAGNFLFTALARTDGTGAILRMQLDGGDPKTFSATPTNSPNDLVASSKDFVYFTDPAFQAVVANPSTGVHRIGADGGGITAVQKFDAGAGPGARADGVALSKDESTLYVGFFDERRIAKYTVSAAGVASNPQNIAFTPADNPTGIAVDVGGNIWIAENDANLTRGRIEVIDAAGKKWGEIPFPDSHPTGIAFGGADGRTVFITTERDAVDGTLYVLTSRCAGVR